MEINAVYPMSPMQRGIAYECELHPYEAVYIGQTIIKLNYENIENYKKAWEYVVNKYEIFRTKFVFGDLKDDIQVVLDKVGLVWKEVCCNVSELNEISNKEKRIKLNEFPLMKFVRATTEDGVYIIWTFHHILLDGWSMSLTLQQVDRMYECLNNNQEIFNLNNCEYSKYISWKITNKKANSEKFWEKYLKGCKGFLFPNISNELTKISYEQVILELSTSVTEITNYCKKQKVSMASFFQAILACTLKFYFGKDDILFQVIDSGRSETSKFNLETIIGILIEDHPKRIKTFNYKTFEELLEYIKLDDIEIKQYNFCSANEVNKMIGVDDAYNVTFVFENYPVSDKNCRFELVNASEISTSDLTFSAGVSNNSALIKIMFSTEIIDKNQVGEIMEYMDSCISSIINSVGDTTLNALSDKIKLSRVKSIIEDSPEEITFYDFIKNKVKVHPKKIAVYDKEKEISYTDLFKMSSELIVSLNLLDIKEDEAVGIYLERSVNSISLMIALQYLGIPYVYLDEKNNQERLEYIIQDSNINMVFIDRKNLTIDKFKFPHISQMSILELNTNIDNKHLIPKRKFEQSTFCQIIYTSGSTGKPKGIEMTVDNIIAFCINNGFYDVQLNDNFAQSSSMAFDASIFEIWLPLLNGATVTIIPDPVFDIFSWTKTIFNRHITIAWLTSGLFNTFTDLDFSMLKGLKRVYIGGEVVSPTHIIKARAAAPGTKFFNGYGPTENTTFTTTFEIPEILDVTRAIPIGKLLANSEAMVVNDENKIVPIGVPGELLISGKGLTNGYHNKTYTTKNVFIEIEVGNEKIQAYRTGDIVCYDGENFHYIGRNDDQIKLRGFRIELGEIEYVLTNLDGVEQGVVVLNKEDGEKNIEAFYVGELEEKQILVQLRDKLPQYMIPSNLYKVQKMPLTINGKIDKGKLLKRLKQASSELESDQEQVDVSIKQKFETVFNKYVPLERLSYDKDLFEYNIDSLKSVRLNHELNKIFKKNVSLLQFIQSKDIKQLVRLYEDVELRETYVKNKYSSKKDVKQLAKATGMQKAMYYFQIENPDLPIYNIPFVKEYKKPIFSVLELKKRFFKFLNQNSVLKAYLKENEEGLLAWFKKNKNTESFFEYFVEDESELRKRITCELNYTFDLKKSEESLIRMSILHYKECVWIVLLTHHIIADGSSIEILLNQLFSDEDLNLNKNSYFDYLNNNENFVSDLCVEYWRNSLIGVQSDIGFLKPDNFYFDHKGSMINIYLDNDFINKLNEISREIKVSKYTIMISLYSQFLMNYFNRESVIVGTPVSTRPSEYEDVFGIFLSFLPYISRKQKNTTLKDIIINNKYLLFEVLEYCHIDFSILEKEAGTANSSNGLSFIQTVFNYQEIAGDNIQKLKECELIAHNHHFTQYPLTITCYESVVKSFLQVEYSTGLFEEEKAKSFIKEFISWVVKAMRELDQPVSKIPIYSDKQSKDIISQLNPKFVIRDTPLKDYLKAISLKNKQLAIVDGKKELSYAELAQLIEDLGQKLKKSGIIEGDRIIFFGNKCWQQILIFYTCLVYKFVYVPIDDKHSKARLNQIIDVVSPNLVFYNEEAINLNIENSCTINELMKESFQISKVQSEVNVKDLAYILFTSGTTGKPKGVQITQKNLANFAATFFSDYQIKSSWQNVFLSSISFDASIMEMMMAIVAGNTLYVFNDEYQFLPDFINTNNINFMIITPALFNSLNFSRCDSLELIISGGEKFRQNSLLPKNVRVINGYGPTEATVCVTYTDNDQESSVGKPISNSCVVIMDDDMNILPCCVQGEICIVGPSVTDSYFLRIDNKNKLVVSPSYMQQYGNLTYKTGDLGYFDNKGNLHYIGRRDNQVKVRGHRIELSEISDRILKFSGIKEVYTKNIQYTETNQDKIISYVVLQDSQIFSEHKLKEFLLQYLPTYMIPDRIISLEKFELTLNGKIDTSNLVKPEFGKANKKIVRPETEIEKLLVSIWENVFQKSGICVLDNYYTIGGDSIKSIQIVSKLREHKLYISIKDILKYQSIRSIGIYLEKINQQPVVIKKGQQLSEFLITPIQKWFFNLQLSNENYWNQSNMIKVCFSGSDKELKIAIYKIYENHPMLRARILKDKTEFKVRIVPSEEVEFDSILEKYTSRKEFINACRVAQSKLDIFSSPTSKLIYYIEEGAVFTYWIVHHLFIDAYSWGIIEDELKCLMEDKIETVNVNDLATDEFVIQQQRKKIDNFSVLPNAQNKLFSNSEKVKVFKINKNNFNKEINIPLLFSSLFFENIIKNSKKELFVYQEKNARFTDTLSMFSISNSVGWMTEFDLSVLSSKESWENIYTKMCTEQNQDASRQVTQAIFLNIISFNTIINDHEIKISDIASENISTMNPLINILNDEEKLIISIMNVKGSEELFNKTLSYMKKLVEMNNLSKYLNYLTTIGSAVLGFRDYVKINDKYDLDTIYPLFPLQEEMIYSSSGTCGSYMNSFLWTTNISLVELIERFNSVFQKYEALRTSIYRTCEEKFVQLVHNDLRAFSYCVYDIRNQSVSEQKKTIQNVIESKKSLYTISEGKYMHGLHLFKIGEKEIRVVWLFNHIILDGWSVGLVVKEIWHPINDKKIKTSNLDYVKWLIKKEDIKYDDYFENTKKTGKLFNENAKIKSSDTENLEYKFSMSKELSRKIEWYARTESLTISHILNAVWGYILCRLTKQEKVIFGMVDSGRNCPVDGIETKVGLFIKTIAYVFNIDKEKDITTFIRMNSLKLNKQLGQKKQDIENLRKQLQIGAGEELFETILVVENYPEPNNSQDIIDVEAREQSNYPLSLSVGISEILMYKLTYNPELISKKSIILIGEWIERLLQTIVDREQVTVELLPDYSQKVSLLKEKYDNRKVSYKEQGKELGEIRFDEIRQIWGRILENSQFEDDQDFFELGGDSLKLSKMIFILNQDYNFKFDVLKFFQNPTLNFLKTVCKDSYTKLEDEKIQSSIELPQVFLGKPQNTNKILVTGATGLLGSEIVYQNLKNGKIVYCIIRSKNNIEAMQRIQLKLNEIKFKEENLKLDNLRVLSGDITKEMFGLQTNEYQSLAEEISIIYHCAANVNFMASLKESCDVNLYGLGRIMKFAQYGLLKKLNYVSTLSVVGHDHFVIEDIELAPISYVKSKVLAEHYLRGYREYRQGVQVSRVGRISGNTRRMKIPEQDLFWRVVATVIQLGSYPEEFTNFETDLTPVDYIAREIIEQTEKRDENRVVNYFSNCMISFKHVIELLQESLGYKLEEVSYKKWIKYAEYDLNENQIKTLIPLFKENVFYQEEENIIITKNSPDKLYQVDFKIKDILEDKVIKCYLKNLKFLLK